MTMSTAEANLVATMKEASKTIQTSARQATALARKHLDDVAALDADWRYNAEQKGAGRRELSDRLNEKLFELDLGQREAKRVYDDARSRLYKAPGDKDASRAVARGAAWARTTSRLDRLPASSPRSLALLDIVADAAKVGDHNTLQAAYVEAPAFLESIGEAMPSVLRAALIQNGGPEAAQAALEIDVADGRSNYRASTATGDLAHEFRSTGQVPAVMVGPREGEVIVLDPAGAPDRMPDGVKAG